MSDDYACDVNFMESNLLRNSNVVAIGNCGEGPCWSQKRGAPVRTRQETTAQSNATCAPVLRWSIPHVRRVPRRARALTLRPRPTKTRLGTDQTPSLVAGFDEKKEQRAAVLLLGAFWLLSAPVVAAALRAILLYAQLIMPLLLLLLSSFCCLWSRF